MKRIVLLALALAGCHSTPDYNTLPTFVTGTIVKNTYDGSTNDLLTGGLGKSGLGSTTVPGFANTAAPTAAELRTLAIYTYRDESGLALFV